MPTNEPTIEQLRKICQDRPDKHDFYMWGVARKVSIYITWLAVRTPITPNQITLLSLLFGVAGAAFFASVSPVYWIVGWLVVNAHLILDQVDGEVAYYKKMLTKFGYFFDEITHPIVNAALFMAVAASAYYASNNPNMLFLGMTFLYSALILRAIGVYSDFATNRMFKLKTERREMPRSWIGRITSMPFGLGGYFHIFVAAAILDIFFTFTIGYGDFIVGSFRELFFVSAAIAMFLAVIGKMFNLRGKLKDSRI